MFFCFSFGSFFAFKFSLTKLSLQLFFFRLSLPKSISFFWNNGSSLRLVFGHQIVSRLFLTIHFTYSFDGLIDYARNVFFGFKLRFFHANRASLFLFLIFLHFFRRLYFSSFNKKHLWISRSALLLLSIRASFLGYVLPYRQISYWRATVIVNLMSVIPFIGPSVCILVWRAYTVNLYTLKRFFGALCNSHSSFWTHFNSPFNWFK